ncbi:hypothetical protein [Rehaibacterium terrae]|jgi:hypothetical protein|uniref:Uncharacterized protein n=1 Tax=Rehaibacterium terrae TaxID=1341696 RepID=A0A7W8DEC6_9GAMM|nr:hypothetical protein [Rehaibacterium terrae]MBB5015663.1 hypothetical protein [Rehaibacterium terrae]
MKRSQVSRMIAVAALLAVMTAGASEVPRQVPATAAAAGTEARPQPEQESAPKAQGNNRGYVVGKGGVARLRDGGPDPADQGGAGQDEVAAKAQGNNRGYVVGKGGVARLRGGGPGNGESEGDGGSVATDGSAAAQAAAAPIGVNEPGVNRAPKGENDPGLSLRTKHKKSEGGD